MLNSKSLIKISAGLILVSTIGFSGKAHAQTATVPFSGSVLNTCIFTTPTTGVLVKSGTSAAMESSGGLTGFTIGTASTVSVDCNGGGSLTVAVPVVASGVPAAFAPAVVQSIVQRGTNTGAADFISSTGGPFAAGAWTKPTTALVLPVGNSALNVAMVAGTFADGPLPSGSYGYNVTLTVVPN